MAQYLVLDIGGTFIKYALMDEKAQFIEQGKVLADTSCEEAMLASLGVLAAKMSDHEYEGVAISMPGRIDTATGIAHTGGAFTWIQNYPAAEKYGAVFGKPCTVANDGKCAASAENWIGALSDVNSGAVLVLGTGIGGGIVINKQVWMGATGGAGELSAFITDHSGVKNGLGWGNIGIMWAAHISGCRACSTSSVTPSAAASARARRPPRSSRTPWTRSSTRTSTSCLTASPRS